MFNEKPEAGTVIKVIAVGGGGGNIVDHMIRRGVTGVDFIAVNTDALALASCLAATKIQIGTTGLGVGGRPEVGREAAMQSRAALATALQGAHMCFITCGLGGGTGTGAAPVIAGIAREMDILTVAVVTRPFAFEGRTPAADIGIEALTGQADALIVMPNDRLSELHGNAPLGDAFRAVDDVLMYAVKGLAEIINVPGLRSVDFDSVCTMLGGMGRAMVGVAETSGPDRARLAAEQAAVNPLLENGNLSGARNVLVNITANRTLKMTDVRDAVKTVEALAAPDAYVQYGTVFDDSMEARLRVTVIATGWQTDL